MSRIIILKPASYLQDLHRLNKSVENASKNLYKWKQKKIQILNKEFGIIEFKNIVDEVNSLRITAIPKIGEGISITDLAKLEKITGLEFTRFKPGKEGEVFLYFKQPEE